MMLDKPEAPEAVEGELPRFDDTRPPPTSASLMARLFIVPALIVSLLVVVAVVIVLFGTTSVVEETYDQLLATLEAGDGVRALPYVLSPGEKAYWQAAQELARRLGERGRSLSPEEAEATTKRLIAILGKYPPGVDVAETELTGQHYVMRALARLRSPEAVGPLSALLNDPSARTRMEALVSLGEMGEVAEVRSALPKIHALLKDPRSEVRLTACVASAALAEGGDAVTIQAVADALRTEPEREVRWNAALALARLGSKAGKLELLNLLDRSFWQGLELAYEERGSTVRRKLAAHEVTNNLIAAVDAAVHLDDPDVGELLDRLSTDESVVVRQAVIAARAKRRAGE